MRGELGGLANAIALAEGYFNQAAFKRLLLSLLNQEAQQFLANYCQSN